MSKDININFLTKCIAEACPIKNIEILCDELNLDQADKHGRTPLMVAAAAGFLDVVVLLLSKGASINAPGLRKLSALHEASANGEIEVANYLVKYGADINAASEDGVTPLMCAAAWGHLNVANVLLKNGANKLLADHLGATASDIAREKGEGKAAEFIDSYL